MGAVFTTANKRYRAQRRFARSPAEHVRELFRIADMVKPLVWRVRKGKASTQISRRYVSQTFAV